MPPRQSQSLEKCTELREQCRSSIFTKMDELHVEQMKSLGEINKSLAFAKGKESGSKFLFLRLLISFGPFFLLLLILGAISWFKGKGWL